MAGILGCHSVWASSISYLNDEEEFTYAFKRMTSLLETFVGENPDLESWLPYVSDYASRSVGIHVGVFSLSEEPDLLSQWRGYAPNGFSIGFSLHRLQEVADASGYTLARCVYDGRSQKRLLKGLLTDSKKLYQKSLEGGNDSKAASESARYRLLVNTVRLAPLLKNPAFKEEREWRLVSGIRRADSGEWHVRVAANHFVPYLKLEMGPVEESPISDVVVGPQPQMDLAHLGLHQLFHCYGFSAKAKKSTTPYRSGG